jgi:hypothetical protein
MQSLFYFQKYWEPATKKQLHYINLALKVQAIRF